MSILSLGQIIGGNQRSLYGLGDRVRNAVSEISKTADSSITGGLNTDATTVSSQRLQARINTFREASQELAKSISDVAFAAQGVEDIGEQLAALEAELGAAADKPLDEKLVQKVNKFLLNTRTQIDAIATRTQILLPAPVEAENSENAQQEVAVKLTSKEILGEKSSITNIADLRQMLTVVQAAAGKISKLGASLKQDIEEFDVMASHLEVSMENQIAASSMLPQEDISILDILMGQGDAAASVQGNRLQSSLMNLI